jgi:hypothetical protein
MLAVVKPSPLRLWGFLLTVVGGALIAFGSIGSWAAVSVGGSTVGAAPTKGIDLWQGKLTVVLGVAIIVGILALRFVKPERRRVVAIGIVIAAALALAVTLWCAIALDSVVHDTGVEQLIRAVVDQLEMSVEQARELVAQAMGRVGISVDAQAGLWIAIAGGALAVAGGLVDLAWVRQKRRAGNAIDRDTLPEADDAASAAQPDEA